MELIKALGLDLKILLAQFVNFSIFAFVLYKFGFKPMLKFLDERKDKIEAGLKSSEAAKKKLEELNKKEIDIITKAKKEALEIIEEAKERGEEKREKMINKAKEEIGNLINSEKEKMQKEKAETLVEIKQEISELITKSLEKILKEKIDTEKDQELIKKIINN